MQNFFRFFIIQLLWSSDIVKYFINWMWFSYIIIDIHILISLACIVVIYKVLEFSNYFSSRFLKFMFLGVFYSRIFLYFRILIVGSTVVTTSTTLVGEVLLVVKTSHDQRHSFSCLVLLSRVSRSKSWQL